MQLTKEEELAICGKKIIIVEGPAGAGKTALLNRLVGIPDVTVVKSSLNKRKFETEEAGHKSFFNDMVKMQESLVRGSPVVFIDRCVASQRVYHAIRTSSQIIPQSLIDWCTEDMFVSLEADLARRLSRKPRKIDLYWLFLIPEAEVLADRRKKGGKDYPNSVYQEITHYKSVSRDLLLETSQLLRPQYNDLADQDYIFQSFAHWLESYPYLTFEDLWRSFATCRISHQKKGQLHG